MSPQRRPSIPRPALWIAVPTFAVSLAVAFALQAGILAALLVGLIGAALVGAFAERRLAAHHLLDRPHRPRRPLHLAARIDRRRRHPEIRRHRRNRARRADRGRYGVGRPAPARNRSPAASRRPAVLHRQFPPRGGRSGQRLHQRRRAHPAHRHRARPEQQGHGAAGDYRLRCRGAGRRGCRRRRRRGARGRAAGDEFRPAGGRSARRHQAHDHGTGARRRDHAQSRPGRAAASRK